MSEEVVTNKSVTYISNATPATITSSELDLASCYKDNEVVIEVHAAALNPIDLMTHQLCCSYVIGKYPKTYSRDYSGVIVKVGKNVDCRWKVGDKVNGMYEHIYGERGSLTHYLILDPAKNVPITHMVEVSKDENDPYDDFVYAAAWPLTFGTAFTVLHDYKKDWSPDSKVLVIGASTSVSYAFIHIAKKYFNIGTVVGICSKNSIERNKKLGYDYLVPYDEGDTVDNVKKLKENELKNKKFDMIFDSVGNHDFFPVIHQFLKPKEENSFYVTIVGYNKINYKNVSWRQFLSLGNILTAINPFKKYNWRLCQLSSSNNYIKIGNQMIKDGTYKPPIDSVYEFEKFQDAIDRLMSNRAKGKVVVKMK
ncbi:yim1p [Saccharomyces arboricola H-6]|uniref:Protein YIM1 n=1 Tax=Saccharomyces arboricola (strain H-6 / AS 2.3317 / CBS 10644) TaxID=1160507 RepID=J8LQ70_SACAR|nr:yim1p [Saccharomyces arboricola H-6]